MARGDNAWSIAERQLGAGSQWRLIWEANQGRDMGDGRRWTEPDVLEVGWELVVPQPGAAPAAAGEPATELLHVVEPGETLSGIAAATLGDPARWPEIYAATTAELAETGHTFPEPDLIYRGQELYGPAASSAVPPPTEDPASPAVDPSTRPGPVEGPSADGTGAPGRPEGAASPAPWPTTTHPAPAPPTTVPVTREGRGAATDERRPPDPRRSGESSSTSPLEAAGRVGALGAAGGMLAAGVLRLRRSRQRRRSVVLPTEQFPAAPPPESAEVMAAVVHDADEATADHLDAALGHLVGVLAPRRGRSCPRPVLVQVRGEVVEVLLAEAALPAPPGWRPQASGAIWALDGPPPEAQERRAAPLPALVTIGRDGEALTLIDLEAAGVVALTGDAVLAEDLARSMVMELASRPDGEGVAVRAVGERLATAVPSGDASLVERCDWSAATDALGEWARDTADALAASGWPHTFAARAGGHASDAWSPVVVIAAGLTLDDLASPTLTDGRPTAGAALVVATQDAPTAALEVRVEGDGTYEIPALGLRGTVQGLPAESAMLAHAAVTSVDGPSEQLVLLTPGGEPGPEREVVTAPITTNRNGHGAPGSTNGAMGRTDWDGYQDPPLEVLVQVLGEITVRGGARPLTPRETAAMAYIALHAPVSVEQVIDALWGGELRGPSTVKNLRTTLRAKLGPATLPRVQGGRLERGPAVLSDLELLERRAAYAAHQAPADAIATLQGGLDLVQGPVFTRPPHAGVFYDWVEIGAENWVPRAEAIVATAAKRLALLHLDAGDGVGAATAARRGLAVSVRLELVELLVRALLITGDEADLAATCRRFAAEVADLDFESLPAEAARVLDLLDHLRDDRRGVRAAAG